MLILIIKNMMKPDSIVHIDQYKNYDTMDTSRFYHKRVNHGKQQGVCK